MAIRSGFFNSVNGDRKYDASKFAEYFASFIGNGVFPNPSTNLQVVAQTTPDMTVIVRPGKAWINGYILINDDDYILQLDPPDGVLNRIDRVVVRYDVADREMRIEVKKGAFASSPVAPALQRDADAYELGIADIAVNAGAVSILQANITDLRNNSELCGRVDSLIAGDIQSLADALNSHLADNATHGVIVGTNGTIYEAIFNDLGVTLLITGGVITNSTLEALCFNDEYVFVSCTSKILVLSRSSLIIEHYITKPATPTAKIMLLDDEYVYLISDKLYKYDFRLNLIASTTVSSPTSAVVEDGGYLYLVEGGKITKRDKATLSIVAETTPQFGYIPLLLAQDEMFIYSKTPISASDWRVTKFDKATLTLSATSPNTVTNTSNGYSLLVKGDYVYHGTEGGRVYKLNKSNLAIDKQVELGTISNNFNYGIYDIMELDNILYLNQGNVLLSSIDLTYIKGMGLYQGYPKGKYKNDFMMSYTIGNGFVLSVFTLNPTVKYYKEKQ